MQLSLRTKVMLLNRAVLSVLDFQCSNWPLQTSVANDLDGLQQRMISVVVNLRSEVHESFGDFAKRRGKKAAARCRQGHLTMVVPMRAGLGGTASAPSQLSFLGGAANTSANIRAVENLSEKCVNA